MRREIITTDRIAPSVGPFSAAVRAGDLLFLSGQVALDPATGKLIAGDIGAQTEQIFANISAVLEAAGKSFDDATTEFSDDASASSIKNPSSANCTAGATTSFHGSLPKR